MSEIEKLRMYLLQFNRFDCPENFYTAWKILVLKTNEYSEEQKEKAIDYSLKLFKESGGETL